MAQQPVLALLRPDHTGRHDHAQRRDVPSVGLGVQGPQDRLGERVADDRDRVDLIALDRAEQLGRIEVPVLHRGDRSTDHQRADRVEQTCAVHQGRSGKPLGAGLDDSFADGIEVLFGRHAALVVGIEGAEHVVLTPHHTLRHPGRATGVEQKQVIATAPPRALGAARIRPSRSLVRLGPIRARSVAVIDPEPQPDARHTVADLFDLRRERSVEDHGGDVGVVPQVHQLIGGVAIVGVDRGHAGLEASVQALDVFGAVVQVLGDLVLLDQTGVEQRSGDAVGTRVELRPGDRPIALLLCEFVGDPISDPLEDIGEVPARSGHVGHRTWRGFRIRDSEDRRGGDR